MNSNLFEVPMGLSACLSGLQIDLAVYVGGVTALGLGVLFVWILMHEEFAGRRYFAATIGGMIGWLALAMLELATPDLACKIAVASATWPAISLAPVAWCLFLWSFCFSLPERPRWLVPVLLAVPVIGISAAGLTNPLHELVYTSQTSLVIENGRLSARFVHGPLFFVAAAVLYVFLLSGFAIAVVAAFRAARPVRPLMMILAFATAIPMAANFSYVTMGATVFGFDPTPFAFSFVLLLLTPVLYSPRGLDIAAMARDLLYFNISDPVFVVNSKGIVTQANPATSVLLPSIMPGRSIEPCNVLGRVAKVASNASNETMEHVVSIGNQRFNLKLLPIARPLGDHGDPLGVVAILSDVTQLKLQEERFRIIADSVSDVLWDYDFDHDTWWVSSDWPEKLGVDLPASAANARTWFTRVRQEDRERLNRSFRHCLKSNEDTWEIDYCVLGDDGEGIDMLVRAAVFRHPDGRVSRMLGNARNISAEKRQAEGYTRARALEALGQLTGGIAHDFNNQLMVILGNAELLAMTELDEGQGESVELIKNASQSARRLIQRLLVFARQSPLGKERIDVRAMLEATIELLSSGLPEWVTFDLQIPEDVWRVSADANGMEQAILNLAVNASDAMPKGGTIVISCRNQVVREDPQSASPELKPGDYVVLSVTDEGEGMSPEVVSKAFDPFYSTKDIGKGAGLGLSTVYGFAKQAGGHAIIHSRPGKGTTVELYLPRFTDQVESDEHPPERSDPEKPGRGERILVVEDQPMVRTHVERLLTKMGYEVTAVSNATQALSRLSLSAKFDLVFTDVVMPGGMTGQDLAEEIKKIDPTMKILFTSGYPAYAFQHLGITEMQELKLLRKPYRRLELQEAITTLLTG